ncbi:autotransporter outer membrane beta-barrel domain-containing protein [Trabulsiella odontotermitis]|uniref:autotransporter outer membrane beta-barrel domain-containing protein n=1 Tax=Trabulsiella odontotermitis TaxID=379893 RepID=UPI00067647DD|nr:autotransporter outer membrane beta-barrel domain-containing protein [Trabulsiella odontotermitis]KNC89779.1 hypothetical protein GM30_05195 [Trabulsiella odontotermitis]
MQEFEPLTGENISKDIFLYKIKLVLFSIILMIGHVFMKLFRYLIFVSVVGGANAASVEWNVSSSSSEDWFFAPNWSPASIPSSGDLIYIGTKPDVIDSVVIHAGNAVGSNVYLGHTSGSTGVLTVESGGSFTSVGTVTLGNMGTGFLKINDGVVSVYQIDDGYFTNTAQGVGHLEITNAGVLNTASKGINFIGYSRDKGAEVSTVVIDGQHSAWNSDGTVIIGAGDFGIGTVTVQNGGLLKVTNLSNSDNNWGLGLGDGVNDEGHLIIRGQGSKVITTPGITVGIAGRGTVSVLDGATLESSSNRYDYDYIGQVATLDGVCAEGHVFVDGLGSSWKNSTGLIIGYAGLGTLTVSNGASVTSIYDSHIGYTRASIGAQQGTNAAHGEVLITGSGSVWTTATLDMAHEKGGEAILTVSNGGTLKTTGNDGIQVGLGGPGVINIGAPADQQAAAPGNIEAENILLVDRNNSKLIFNHTATEMDEYILSSSLSGEGTVNIESGVTQLTGLNRYSGFTLISGGILKAGSGNAFSPNSDFVVERDGMLDVNGISQTLGALSNAGIINMARYSAGTTLTVAGNYTGEGGTVYFNTKLMGDPSETDKFVIHGNTSGNTQVAVNNIGNSCQVTFAVG